MVQKYRLQSVSFMDLCSSYSRGEDIRLLFPSPVREQLLAAQEPPAVGGVAGRDTAACILVAFSQGVIRSVLPILTMGPVLFGGDFDIHLSNDYRAYQATNEYLKSKISQEFGGVIYDIVSVGDSEFWGLLNGRYISETLKKFGFFSPCVACHLYFYTIRSIVAKALGSSIVISGARDSHDGRKKISQLPSSTEAIQQFLFDEFKVKQIQPLRAICDGKEIEKIIGREWKQGEEQVKCLFSQNYTSVDGCQLLIEEWRVKEYLYEFAFPLTKAIVEARLRGEKNVEKVVQPICQTIFG